MGNPRKQIQRHFLGQFDDRVQIRQKWAKICEMKWNSNMGLKDSVFDSRHFWRSDIFWFGAKWRSYGAIDVNRRRLLDCNISVVCSPTKKIHKTKVAQHGKVNFLVRVQTTDLLMSEKPRPIYVDCPVAPPFGPKSKNGAISKVSRIKNWVF